MNCTPDLDAQRTLWREIHDLRERLRSLREDNARNLQEVVRLRQEIETKDDLWNAAVQALTEGVKSNG